MGKDPKKDDRHSDEPGIGILPDGKLNIVKPDAPRFEPEIIPNPKGKDEEVDDVDEYDNDDLSDLDDI